MGWFLALWLIVISLAWAKLDPASVRAIAPARAPLRGLARLGPLAKPTPKPAADLVVVVSIDGLRPDVITPSMKALHRLYLQGTSAKVARTIDQSATLPSHASMVSGVDPSQHGLNFNSYKPEHANIARPTVFSVAHAAGLPTFMFVGKAKLRHLLGKASDAELKVAGIHCKRLVKEATPQLQKQKRGLLFMHFADPDSAGHRYGWMSDEYLDAARHADDCVESVMETIEQGGLLSRTLLIVTSDHGGHGRSHGTRMEVDQRIPWYAWGAGARRGRAERPIHTTDTAATVIAALGLKAPETVQGHPVAEALGAGAGPLVGNPFEDDSSL